MTNSQQLPSPSHQIRRQVVLLALLAALVFGSLATAQTTYLAYGDSITEGTGDGTGIGYPGRLENLLANSTVINRGQAGGTTTDLLADFNDEVRGQSADVLLLMAGTNDVTRVAQRDTADVGVETALQNLNLMARRARDAGMTTIHATVIPRWPAAKHGANNIVTRIFNSEVRNLAGINNRDLVDVNEHFRQEPRHFGLYYAARDGDPVGHPNGAGYDVIAQAFADVINDVDSIGPAPGVISPFDGEKLVGRNSRILIDLWDFGAGIDPDSVEIRVDGNLVPESPIVIGDRVTVNHTPAGRLRGMVVVNARASDRANPPHTLDRDIATFFTTQTNFPRGDLNRDGRVDGLDLLILANGFGQTPDSFRWDNDADIDGDGDIDGNDLAILVDNFGTTL